MAFKINPPYETSSTPIYHKDMDDNTLGLANNNGTILLNKNTMPNSNLALIDYKLSYRDRWMDG